MTTRIVSYPIFELGQRSNQEDCLFPSPKEAPSSGPLFILCDGMGGHAAGEIASQTVCAAMSSYVLSNCTKEAQFNENDFEMALGRAYDALDEKDTDDEKKMGTTLAFAMFHEGGCFVAHIGDSRIYHIRPSARQILFVTHDHSLVNELIELGEMTPEEAKTSRKKNIITRAMQPHQDSPPKADWTNLTDLKPDDYLYMCSDGMLEQMDDEELLGVLCSPVSDEEKIGRLKKATRDNRDNHSAYLIRVLPQDIRSRRSHRISRILFWVLFAIILTVILAFFFLYQ